MLSSRSRIAFTGPSLALLLSADCLWIPLPVDESPTYFFPNLISIVYVYVYVYVHVYVAQVKRQQSMGSINRTMGKVTVAVVGAGK